MAYDKKLADGVRKALGPDGGLTERKMFGGIAFMLRGNMCCGIVKDELMVRVGADGFDDALRQPHARPMDFTGRPMKGFVFVGPAGMRTEAALAKWVRRGAEFAASLPAK
jgi:TfoX/Sxy family transcriptional regulator of competence genes